MAVPYPSEPEAIEKLQARLSNTFDATIHYVVEHGKKTYYGHELLIPDAESDSTFRIMIQNERHESPKGTGAYTITSAIAILKRATIIHIDQFSGCRDEVSRHEIPLAGSVFFTNGGTVRFIQHTDLSDDFALAQSQGFQANPVNVARSLTKTAEMFENCQKLINGK